MIRIEKYNPQKEKIWNEFIATAKNSTFLFNRNYMDYHADRFTDNSLMFFKDETLIALLPANLKNDILYSHQGLTYGGFIIGFKARSSLMLELFEELINYLKSSQIKKFIYKPIPQFYNAIPSQEDLYALFRNNAQLFRRDVSSVINLKDKIQFNELRQRMIKKATAQNLEVKESKDFESFYKILQENLQTKHATCAVHSLEEITKLSQNFPENIKLYSCFKDGVILAATWIFINRRAIHLQYIASNEEGRKSGALDLIINHLINEKYQDKNYFDFGISTEENGKVLNEGLVNQKEMFGARAYCCDHYSIEL